MGHGDDNGWGNDSGNHTFDEVLEARVGRRRLMIGGLASAAGFFAGPVALSRAAGAATTGASTTTAASSPLLGFASVANTGADTVVVPPGYTARPFIRWGDPVNPTGPAFKPDATNTTEEQEQQWGMHNDGMHYFPLSVATANVEGLLVANHEYTDDGLLHPGGMEPWTADKVRKSQAAHGVSVVHIRKQGGNWQVVDSPYARRITGYTPTTFSGPAAGHRLLRTGADPTGKTALGTLNNCSNGATPWGTYLTCEENFNGYFTTAADPVSPEFRRYGIAKDGFGYRWHEWDKRFDADSHPHEPNRFGWVVEVNPWEPNSAPVKRTALGRFKHEGAFVTEANDGRAVVYSGDDERFEYIYKFVSTEPWRDAIDGGRSPLDEGTLHVARFSADGTGTWIPLVWSEGGLTAAMGFADQGEVLVKARQAGDAVGATKMDRPEWITQNPLTRELYVTLTNNTQRGTEGRAPTDAANPRPRNSYGHILRWWEQDLDSASTTFTWDIYLLAGDPAQSDPTKQGTFVGNDAFGSPDGLAFDDDGRIWIQTDISVSNIGRTDYANVPNNAMLAGDPHTAEVRRFLVGPKGCEVTGIAQTPNGRTMFVNIQHPGEPTDERTDPTKPLAISTWPDGPTGGRPRSSLVVIEKNDGGVIGT